MRKILLLVLVSLGMTLSGCGVDWFPAPEPVVSDFTFTAATNAGLGSTQTSNEVTLAITSGPAKISVSGGTNSKYSINGGTFTSSPGTVKDGDRVKVQHTAASSVSTETKTTLTVGRKSATFTSTTGNNLVINATGTPDAFVFTPVTLHIPTGSYTIHINDGGTAGYTVAPGNDPESAEYFYAGFNDDQTVTLTDGQLIYLVDTAPGTFADSPKVSTTVINFGTALTITYNVTNNVTP